MLKIIYRKIKKRLIKLLIKKDARMSKSTIKNKQ